MVGSVSLVWWERLRKRGSKKEQNGTQKEQRLKCDIREKGVKQTLQIWGAGIASLHRWAASRHGRAFLLFSSFCTFIVLCQVSAGAGWVTSGFCLRACPFQRPPHLRRGRPRRLLIGLPWLLPFPFSAFAWPAAAVVRIIAAHGHSQACMPHDFASCFRASPAGCARPQLPFYMQQLSCNRVSLAILDVSVSVWLFWLFWLLRLCLELFTTYNFRFYKLVPNFQLQGPPNNNNIAEVTRLLL